MTWTRSGPGSSETGPGPAIASQANITKYETSSKPSRVSSESTAAHFAEAIATTMMIIIGTAMKRVSNPAISSSPPANSMPDTKGARTSGAGMPQSRKFSIIRGRMCSLVQPDHRNTQPTTMRTASGPAQVKWPATRRDQS